MGKSLLSMTRSLNVLGLSIGKKKRDLGGGVYQQRHEGGLLLPLNLAEYACVRGMIMTVTPAGRLAGLLLQ